MFANAQKIIDYLEALAPKHFALEGDPVGLQVGNPERKVKSALVALDFDEHVFEEAVDAGAQMVITHHPFIYRPLAFLDTRQPLEKLLAKVIKEEIIIYSAHTNLDIAPGGVNDVLARLFKLKSVRILEVTGCDGLEKLAVFVPREHVKQVREALILAGAGTLGNYGGCTFSVNGKATFQPQEGASPYVGEVGKLALVEEVRLETVFSPRQRQKILDALFKTHPYEEVAYDIYPLKNDHNPYGAGRIGLLEEPCSLKELAERCKRILQTDFIKVSGCLSRRVERIAVCGGSGSSLINIAANSGADVLITGDVKYHDAREGYFSGLAIIDAGHDVTEKPVIAALAEYLREKLAADDYCSRVRSAVSESALWQTGT